MLGPPQALNLNFPQLLEQPCPHPQSQRALGGERQCAATLAAGPNWTFLPVLACSGDQAAAVTGSWPCPLVPYFLHPSPKNPGLNRCPKPPDVA
jgi:hypothetical protein